MYDVVYLPLNLCWTTIYLIQIHAAYFPSASISATSDFKNLRYRRIHDTRVSLMHPILSVRTSCDNSYDPLTFHSYLPFQSQLALKNNMAGTQSNVTPNAQRRYCIQLPAVGYFTRIHHTEVGLILFDSSCVGLTWAVPFPSMCTPRIQTMALALAASGWWRSRRHSVSSVCRISIVAHTIVRMRSELSKYPTTIVLVSE